MKCGYVCIAGPPNVGKSTLVNRIMAGRVSIVTRKAQTTRVSVECIYTKGKFQAIFLDTPGILSPKGTLQKSMSKEARRSISKGDIRILLLDASKNLENQVHLASKFQILALNKIDLVKQKESLLKSTQVLTEKGGIEKVFMISALKNNGVEDLLSYVCNALPEQEWIYQEDKKTNLSKELCAAEMTRETIFLQVHQEIPYNLWVKTTSWRRKSNGTHIEQTIYVGKESHKPILVGAKGSKISVIGEISRKKIGKVLKEEVHLFLQVKVDKDWQNKSEYYNSWLVKKP